MQERGGVQPLTDASPAELLSSHDSILGRIIDAQPARWSAHPIEDPIWGLTRMIMAQQVSTSVACRIAQRVKSAFPDLAAGVRNALPDCAELRAFGLTERRAKCCVDMLNRSDDILERVRQGQTWEQALADIKGIGPWTVSVFRIMVLRHPDVLPLGDIGLERAIRNVYGRPRNVQRLGKRWKPFRSVACWYLWRTLGNEQLG